MLAVAWVLSLLPLDLARAEGTLAPPVVEGQRVFSCGHSFHEFVPGIVRELARLAGIEGHEQLGLSYLGGSTALQHWRLPETKNGAKPALRAGQVDVLTLSLLFPPDEGLENFARLGLEHRPEIRVTVQQSWLPYDVSDVNFQRNPRPHVDRDARSGDELRKIHADYFRNLDDYVAGVNQRLGRRVLLVVPAGQAVIALREKIAAGQGAGLRSQAELFSDGLGHAQPPLRLLVAYCHFAVIYRRTPVGLPVPGLLKQAQRPGHEEAINRLLQELAWNSVVQHPLAGVQAEPAAQSRQSIGPRLDAQPLVD